MAADPRLSYNQVNMADPTLSEELKWRGFINQTTINDLSVLDKHKRTFYIGFDASADSQTVGNLAAVMFAKCFIRHGYKAIILAGGATSLIGDPGGKDEERSLQDEATIEHNIRRAEEQLKKLMSGQDFKLVNNLEWSRDLKVLPFLRDIGKHFSMTPLTQRDYIAKRLGEHGAGISYAEFSYTILQGYDYLHLFDNLDATLQLGGSDQWGNCLSGVELIRKARGKVVDALTINLILNKATGQKFGKTEVGAIWLDPKKTPPNEFYQFWVNISDEDVGDYLKIFTELDRDRVGKIMTEFEKNKSGRLAQTTLAYEVTKLVHGQQTAEAAKSHANKLVDATLDSTGQVKAGDSIIEALVKYGLATSKTEARQLLDTGGIYINNSRSAKTVFEVSDFKDGRAILRRGKTLRNTVVLRLR